MEKLFWMIILIGTVWLGVRAYEVSNDYADKDDVVSRQLQDDARQRWEATDYGNSTIQIYVAIQFLFTYVIVLGLWKGKSLSSFIYIALISAVIVFLEHLHNLIGL
jgi:hypothetical protein